MKNYYFIFIVFLFTGCNLFSQGWQWGKRLFTSADTSSPIPDETRMAVHTSHVYTALRYHSNGCYTCSQYKILHYTSSGFNTWIQYLPFNVEILAMETDVTGNIVAAGTFVDTMQIGSQTIIASGAAYGYFILKFSTNGQLVFLQSPGRVSHYTTNCALHVNGANQVYLVTDLSDSLYTGAFKQVHDTSRTETVIAKFDANGNLLSSFKDSGPQGMHYAVEGTSLLELDSGKLYIGELIAYYTGSSRLRILSSAGQTLVTMPINDYYCDIGKDSRNMPYVIRNTGSHYSTEPRLMKMNQQLQTQWSLDLGGEYSPYIFVSMQIDPHDRIFLGGRNGNSFFGYSGKSVIGSDTLPYAGEQYMAFAELDTNGQYVKVIQKEVHGSTELKMKADESGGLYFFAGYTQCDTSFTVGSDTVDFIGQNVYGGCLFKYGYMGTTKAQEFAAPNYRVYPNPAKDMLCVEVIDPHAEVILYNTHGDRIDCPKTCEVSKIRVSINELPAGIYFLQIRNQQVEITRKIVIY